MKALEVVNAQKNFLSRKRTEGFFPFVQNLFCPKYNSHVAVDSISFCVDTGEKVAFIGPNGAGKSTTIKLLCGIIFPDSGTVRTLGYNPFEERKTLAYHIGAVFGGRPQLVRELAAIDSFNLLAAMYEIENSIYKRRLNHLVDLFDLEKLIQKPVGQLSLGERMRCEVVGSLLHNPKILFLDEPTIGLDVLAKLQMRKLLNNLCKEENMTLFLTSHDTDDVEHIAERAIIIDKGTLISDSTLDTLKRMHRKKKRVHFIVEKPFTLDLKGVRCTHKEANSLTFEVTIKEQSIEHVIIEALKSGVIKDISIEEESLEEIIREIYGSRKTNQ